jgi:hypothetical protein
MTPTSPFEPFPHRRNPDGSFDSICPKCFRTVATRRDEADLAQAERDHVCEDDGIDFPPPDREKQSLPLIFMPKQ